MNETRRLRILVVDDDPGIVKFIRICLINQGYEVLAAADGMEAIEAVRREQPELLIMDMFMPEKDGFEVLTELRTFSNVPVIALSAQRSALPRAMSLGADDCILKPFHPEMLLERVKAFIS